MFEDMKMYLGLGCDIFLVLVFIEMIKTKSRDLELEGHLRGSGSTQLLSSQPSQGSSQGKTREDYHHAVETDAGCGFIENN